MRGIYPSSNLLSISEQHKYIFFRTKEVTSYLDSVFVCEWAEEWNVSKIGFFSLYVEINGFYMLVESIHHSPSDRRAPKLLLWAMLMSRDDNNNNNNNNIVNRQ